MNTPTKRISTAIAYQLQLLIDRLLTLGAVDPDEYREDEIDWMHWIGPDTGEIVVALIVRERTYWEDSRSKDIIVQREAQGRMEWTRLDEDGEEIEPWDWARPRGAVRGSTSQGATWRIVPKPIVASPCRCPWSPMAR